MTTTVSAGNTAVLFDLDGVLLDSAAAVRATVAAVATCALGRRISPADLPVTTLLRPRCQILAELGVPDPDDAVARWWDPALAAATTHTAPFPDIADAVHGLHARGTRTGLVTLQDRHRLPWLLPPDLTGLFTVIVGRGDAPPKPAPDGILSALHRLGTSPEHAAFVGDTPTDITAARAAGVAAIGVTWGYAPAHLLRAAGADQIAHHPRELVTLTGAPAVGKPA